MGILDPGSALHFREILKAQAKLESNTSMFLIFKAFKSLQSNVSDSSFVLIIIQYCPKHISL